MKKMTFVFILCLIPIVYADDVAPPPQSLAQWYQPQNKRNVWLHTMFNLRRAVQAIETYSAAHDVAHVQQWTQQLVKDYRNIAEMMPEWQDKLDLTALAQLSQAAENNDNQLHRALKKIKQSCHGCHVDYRAHVAALYRAPDFSKIKIKNAQAETQTYEQAMNALSVQLNQIKIGLVDKQMDSALQAVDDLRQGIDFLAESCGNCHQETDARDYYLGQKTQQLLTELKQQIRDQDPKAGQQLGALAVRACARCHGTHKILTDLVHTVSLTQ